MDGEGWKDRVALLDWLRRAGAGWWLVEDMWCGRRRRIGSSNGMESVILDCRDSGCGELALGEWVELEMEV